MNTVKDLIRHLNLWAPLSLQESYDNGGLIAGDADQVITGVLCCLDCTEQIIEEAIERKCNVVLAHHPIVFSGLKKLTGRTYVERTIIYAIKHDIAIIAWHTALDNVSNGVNGKIGDVLGIKQRRILQPKENGIFKLVVYVPHETKVDMEQALFAAGAGHIGNYQECSFTSAGEGSFKPMPGSNPTEGQIGERSFVSETKIEVVVPEGNRGNVHQAMIHAHPYEEVAHEWIRLSNERTDIGSGMVGDLDRPIDVQSWMKHVKDKMGVAVIRHTALVHTEISKVAWCGGSGDFLLERAIAAGAQVLITSDFKYHRFFDHENKIIVMDIGHYESESCVIDLLSDWLTENFTTFAIHKTWIVTNPVQYF
jgi:dinuclear metal center YbgI/SA1388 family protein